MTDPRVPSERVSDALLRDMAAPQAAQIWGDDRILFYRLATELLELRAQLAQEPVGQVKEKPGSHGIWVLWTREVAPGDLLYAAPPCAEHDRLAQCPVIWGPEQQDVPGGKVYRVGGSTGVTLPPQPETQAGKWTDRAFAALGYLRDNMPPNDVTIVQRFLDAAAPEIEERKP